MDEMPDWYTRWIDHHRSVFVLNAEWVAAAALWWDVFATAGVNAFELAAATREFQLGTPPRYAGDHLPAIRSAVGRMRDRAIADRAARAELADGDRPVCTLCGNTGICVVPHPLHIREGAWEPTHHRQDGTAVRVTVGVVCHCRKDFGGSGNGDRPRPMRMAEYERLNPHWRDMIEADAAERATAERAIEVTPKRFPNLEKLIAGIAAPVRA